MLIREQDRGIDPLIAGVEQGACDRDLRVAAIAVFRWGENAAHLDHIGQAGIEGGHGDGCPVHGQEEMIARLFGDDQSVAGRMAGGGRVDLTQGLAQIGHLLIEEPRKITRRDRPHPMGGHGGQEGCDHLIEDEAIEDFPMAGSGRRVFETEGRPGGCDLIPRADEARNPPPGGRRRGGGETAGRIIGVLQEQNTIPIMGGDPDKGPVQKPTAINPAERDIATRKTRTPQIRAQDHGTGAMVGQKRLNHGGIGGLQPADRGVGHSGGLPHGLIGTDRGRPCPSIATKVKIALVTRTASSVSRPRRQASTEILIEVRPTDRISA